MDSLCYFFMFSDLIFRMVSLKDLTVLLENSCVAHCVPTELQLTEDSKYVITNNVLRPEQGQFVPNFLEIVFCKIG